MNFDHKFLKKNSRNQILVVFRPSTESHMKGHGNIESLSHIFLISRCFKEKSNLHVTACFNVFGSMVISLLSEPY